MVFLCRDLSSKTTPLLTKREELFTTTYTTIFRDKQRMTYQGFESSYHNQASEHGD